MNMNIENHNNISKPEKKIIIFKIIVTTVTDSNEILILLDF